MTSLQAEPRTTLEKRHNSKAAGRFLAGGLLIVGVLMISAVAPAFLLANILLAVRDNVKKADVIVVLGGDGPSRAAWASDLWLKGIAPRVLISGDGDCYWIRQGMIERGVDEGSITVECQSGTTWENALFSAPILKDMDAHTAVLVTSWYHSRRAKASFAATSANIHWKSVPVERSQPLWKLAFSADGVQLLKEYPKTIWYAVRLLLGVEPTRGAPPEYSREVRT